MPGVDALCELNPTVAYQVDNAVVMFGTIIENALQERVETGSGANRQSKPRYTLNELLRDGFRLQADDDPLAALRGLDGYQEVH